MKIIKYLLKIISIFIGLAMIIYVTCFFAILLVKDSVSKKNIREIVYKQDLITDTQTILELDDRNIDRRIND